MKMSALLIAVLLVCAISSSFAEDCHYELPGDFNYDCIFNLVDVSWIAQFWLIDCHDEPLDPECVPLDLDEDGYDIISDCNDHNPAINPGATEVCDNNIDDDCDDLVDCDDDDCSASPSCGNWWYYDGDMDNYGDPTNSTWSVTQPAGYVLDNTDCDDGDNLVNPGASEICDGVDNNCSGVADEGLIAPSCALQNGVCSGSVQTCGGVMGWLLCDTATYTTYNPNYQAGVEMSCDNLDNDCDGTTDEGNPGGGAPCDGPDSDLCQEGIMTCSAGMLNCSDVTGDDLDLCNGIDDDCDPSSADGSEDPLDGALCDGADTDLCDEGMLFCSAGALTCSDVTGDNLEVCDNLDNDCDGTTDEGNPGGGAPCDGPDSDLCQEGIMTCSGGMLNCSDVTGDDLDICNGIDDDCDPSSLDGSDDPMNGMPCDGADTDLCMEGMWYCSGGSITCSDTSGDTLEICGDTIDNDCDGLIDGADPDCN